MTESTLRRLEALVNRLAAVVRGRKAPPSRRLQTAQDVIDLLEEQVETLRAEAGAGALEKARALGRLAAVARQAIETGNLAARLTALEAAQKERDSEGQSEAATPGVGGESKFSAPQAEGRLP